MKILNLSNKFLIGRNIVAIKKYTNGLIKINIGNMGIVKDVTVDNFPDLGYFDLKIIHFIFDKHKFGMEEKIAESYFDIT